MMLHIYKNYHWHARDKLIKCQLLKRFYHETISMLEQCKHAGAYAKKKQLIKILKNNNIEGPESATII